MINYNPLNLNTIAGRRDKSPVDQAGAEVCTAEGGGEYACYCESPPES